MRTFEKKPEEEKFLSLINSFDLTLMQTQLVALEKRKEKKPIV